MTDALDRVQPRLMVCGHVHSGYGRYRLGVTEVINAALVNNAYALVNPVVEITL
jgi:Icc-related predicted phosphoesterase